MAGNLVLLDSNILIRWIQPRDPAFASIETSIQMLVSSGAVLCYTSQNIGEFWNVLTRPVDRNGYGLIPVEADERTKMVEETFKLLTDIPVIHEEWRRILVKYRISGVQVHDARLAAAMLVHGVRRVLTLNKTDFSRFDFIETVLPQDLVSSR
jgi:predicted nucleic acid-binding protein